MTCDAAVGRFDDLPRERVDVELAVGGARRHDAVREPERAAALELVGRAGGADDARAERRARAAARRCRRRNRPRARAPTRRLASRPGSPARRARSRTPRGRRPSSTRSRPSGTGAHCAGGHDEYSACAPPPAMPNTRSPTSTPVDAGADRLDDARELEAGDVGREPAGGVEPEPLEQVGAVEPGAVDPHEDLSGPRAPGSGARRGAAHRRRS